MTMKRRLDKLNTVLQKIEKPKRGIVKICLTDADGARADAEFKKAPKGTPCVRITVNDASMTYEEIMKRMRERE